jgi:hypothetical protein
MAISNEVAEYIRQAAIARGIDPNVALKVAMAEGGVRDPFRHGEGPAPRSQAKSLGNREHSFGPFQLYISGNGAGLGDRALRAGIDPRKNWRGGIDFALDEVVNKGWGQWYGAKAAGITGKYGVGKNARAVGASGGGSALPVGPNPSQVGATPDTPAQYPGKQQPTYDGGSGAGSTNEVPGPTVQPDKSNASWWDNFTRKDEKGTSKLGKVAGALSALGGFSGGSSQAAPYQPLPTMEVAPGPDTALPDPASYMQPMEVIQTAAGGGPVAAEEDYEFDPEHDPNGDRFSDILQSFGVEL